MKTIFFKSTTSLLRLYGEGYNCVVIFVNALEDWPVSVFKCYYICYKLRLFLQMCFYGRGGRHYICCKSSAFGKQWHRKEQAEPDVIVLISMFVNFVVSPANDSCRFIVVQITIYINEVSVLYMSIRTLSGQVSELHRRTSKQTYCTSLIWDIE